MRKEAAAQVSRRRWRDEWGIGVNETPRAHAGARGADEQRSCMTAEWTRSARLHDVYFFSLMASSDLGKKQTGKTKNSPFLLSLLVSSTYYSLVFYDISSVYEIA